MLTQRELDRFVAMEKMTEADQRRYEVTARAMRERMRHLEAPNGILAVVSPILDSAMMAIGGAVLVLAIFG